MASRLLRIVAVLAALAGLAACGGGTEPPKPIMLKLAVADPGPSGTAQVFPILAEEIATRTNGRIKVEIIWGGALFKDREILEGVQSGAAEMGTPYITNHPDKLPLLQGPMGNVFPFVQLETPEFIRRVRLVVDKVPAVGQEFERWNQILVAVYPLAPYYLPSNKPFTKLEDFKGAKIGGPGRIAAASVQAVGGVPVSIPAGEMYEGMQKGVIDARVLSYDATVKFKLHEVSKYFVEVGFGHLIGPSAITINKDVFQRLSPELQKAILEAGRAAETKAASLVPKWDADARKIVEGAGVKILRFDPAETAKWANLPAVAKITDDWVREMEAKGLPGKEVARIMREGT